MSVPNNPQGPWWDQTNRWLDSQVRKSDIELDCAQWVEASSSQIATVVAWHKLAESCGRRLILGNVTKSLREQLQTWPQGHYLPQALAKGEGWFATLGSVSLSLWEDLRQIAYFFSESVYWSTLGRWDGKRLPFRGVAVAQMVQLGSSALPIVGMLSFLIGLTLAFQSAVQLEIFGASLFLVRGVGITMVSEIGPLITAIILAGRSGSAITAELSSMVVQEEVKALRTMGINPVQFLIMPRFQALSLTAPLLTVLSASIGIFAGFVVALLYSGIPPALFATELREAVSITMLGQMLTKSLVFGWIIVLVACRKGLSVRGGATAVGKATTSCVVFSISAIIVANALFSFLFYW